MSNNNLTVKYGPLDLTVESMTKTTEPGGGNTGGVVVIPPYVVTTLTVKGWMSGEDIKTAETILVTPRLKLVVGDVIIRDIDHGPRPQRLASDKWTPETMMYEWIVSYTEFVAKEDDKD